MGDKIDWNSCSMCGRKLTGLAEDCPCLSPSPVEELRAKIYSLSADPEIIDIFDELLNMIEEVK